MTTVKRKKPAATTKAQKALVAERRAKLVQARLEGRRYEDIYEELGYSSRYAASRDFSRILEQNIAEQHASMEVFREAELMKLDDLTREAISILRTTHYVVTQSGRIPEDPRTGQPLIDHDMALKVIDRLVRIGDRRAKLLGLDAPQRVEVLTLDAIDAHIAELSEQLATFDAEAPEATGAESTPD